MVHAEAAALNPSQAANAACCLGALMLSGTAAINVNGTTIHSWAGLLDANASAGVCAERLWSWAKYMDTYRSTDVLVLDEISMVDCELLEKVCMLLYSPASSPEIRLSLLKEALPLIPTAGCWALSSCTASSYGCPALPCPALPCVWSLALLSAPPGSRGPSRPIMPGLDVVASTPPCPVHVM
jgi:hypothetical protein